MVSLLTENLLNVLKAVAPLTAVVSLLQFTVIHAPEALFLQFLTGSALAIVGMALLFSGIDFGILPMGRFVGAALPEKGSLALIVAVSFALGFATTVAEPDVLVLAGQVDAASRGAMSRQTVVYVIALGVAVLTAVAMVRIVAGWRMKYLLAAAYLVALILSAFAPVEFVSLAFDAGSVTTGALSAPVMISLGIGLSSVLAGRSKVSDGFGLLGLASIGPIIAILILGRLLP
ncbi:DUF1538 domain-containing protein [Methylocystis parvus]|uniref:DUF1538 domain-containing protein n=1 Tax=Methylocystis parvus TaxID=134 RepID=A0A6B8M4Z3_9HYPH|nr:DUF1538 domain-containing protein [Methylocystis parvus]QGM97446.1 DUF1538 domain-containing protein [Methylocystis parvus]WBJ98636.1 DUF1538 domain-containing protein [Methylocystis parvus OBBP]